MTTPATTPAHTPAHASAPAPPDDIRRETWLALSALVLGFFMILVDSTIVSVATPAIIEDFGADVNTVVWVTSAYLLAYAVPMLITGRLGDRVGPKRMYLAGLVVFTLSSLWCGLTGTIEGLVIARVVQGLGASMMSPQTMAIITRIFPAARRGAAMAVWGATAGVATLVGPILGGFLVDAAGWPWVFFVNVPVGIIAFVLASRLVPRVDTHAHAFDWLGVALSAVGMFLLVFGIQEGHQHDWNAVIWSMIVVGLLVLALFIAWQARNRREPLVPLGLFRDRNFAVANLAISTMGFAITAMAIPLMIWAQVVRGLSPTRAALLMAPMALASLLLAPIAGRLTDRVHPRLLTALGFTGTIISLVWTARIISPTTALWSTVAPMLLLGIGNSFVWGPNSASATRNLPPRHAGAGSGVYNTTRQVGAVLGSAAIAVLMDSRLAAQGLGAMSGSMQSGSGHQLPAAVAEKLSIVMAESLYLPAAVLVIGLLAVLFFERPGHLARR